MRLMNRFNGEFMPDKSDDPPVVDAEVELAQLETGRAWLLSRVEEKRKLEGVQEGSTSATSAFLSSASATSLEFVRKIGLRCRVVGVIPNVGEDDSPQQLRGYWMGRPPAICAERAIARWTMRA